jgi:cytosine deaminase
MAHGGGTASNEGDGPAKGDADQTGEARADELSPADRLFLDAAYEQALKSAAEGGVPIGAALGLPAPDGSAGVVLALGHNLRTQTGDTTAHAETVCLRNAGRRRDWPKLTLATTLSPCIMCAGAARLHRIGRVVVGEHDTFPLGGDDSGEAFLRERGVAVVVAHDRRCRELLAGFVAQHPELWDEDIGVPPSAQSADDGSSEPGS